jgi:hypothetical protein
MRITRLKIGRHAILTGLVVASASIAAGAMIVSAVWTTLQPLPAADGPAPAGRSPAKPAATYALPRAAPDVWTSDAPVVQAKLSQSRLVASISPPPPPPPKAAPAAAPDVKAAAQPASPPPALALAPEPAKDDSKLCRSPVLPLDIAHAAASIHLSDPARLATRPLDIPPPGPPPEQERRLRLSALLADALSQ